MNFKSVLESSDKIKYDLYLQGLTETTVRAISQDQNEPEWMLKHRLKSLEIFNNMPMPNRGPSLDGLDFDEIVYYAKPSQESEGYATDREDVDPEIKKKFERLGIPEAERKYLAGAGGQYDSLNVYHKIKQQRSDKGIIFEDMPQALHTHPQLVQKYFMKLVPATDHKFAALHGAVRSGGTFIYVPKGIKLDEPLQAYFRMNTYAGGQFEHTLIIIDDDAQGNYIEGCSAPKYDKASLHAGLVEVFVGKNSHMKYSSVENRSTNTYNLNTKRALLEESSYMERVNGNMGSCTTMLYPCSILKGDNSKTDLLGIAVAGKGQNQDTGSKVIHIGKNTSSTIVSKSISKDGGIATYRGLVKIAPQADNSVNSTNCDALLLDNISISNTIPDIVSDNDSSIVAHEASAGKIDESEMFYLMARGLDQERAMSMIVNGFFSSVVKKLPLEYAGELNKLIELEMEGSVG
ncbi:Fe-S cluster assembly protein SufB [Candidatus Gracilibacteria bacterium]|nr:Fe-S cluster assembly protein SufB [Candidatus Gracilibacteria bacterium]